MLNDRSISQTRPPGRVFSARHRQSGYTVVELVVVLVLLGILAVNALPRFFEAGRFEEMGYADGLSAAIRYAQRLAIASRCETRVRVDASGYALFQRANNCTGGAFSQVVNRPGSADWSGATPLGLSVGAMDIYFDAWGRPHDVTSGLPLAASQTLSVGSRTLTLEHTTGYVWAG